MYVREKIIILKLQQTNRGKTNKQQQQKKNQNSFPHIKTIFGVTLQIAQGCLLFSSEINHTNNSRKLMNWTVALLVVPFPNSE